MHRKSVLGEIDPDEQNAMDIHLGPLGGTHYIFANQAQTPEGAPPMRPLLMALFGVAPLFVAVGAAAQAQAPAPAPAPEYAIRETDPRTGSNIRRSLIKGSPIPINKRYEELSAEEKNSLNQSYESMGPGDEPPFPADGLKPIHQALAKAQQKLLVRGEIVLIATVAPDGNVAQVRAVGSPNAEMARFASTVLLLTKFKPARCKGEPCKMDYPFRFDFEDR